MGQHFSVVEEATRLTEESVHTDVEAVEAQMMSRKKEKEKEEEKEKEKEQISQIVDKMRARLDNESCCTGTGGAGAGDSGESLSFDRTNVMMRHYSA